jgi:hypothetical protein
MDGVELKEVAGEDRMRLGRQEGTPRRPGSTGCRIDAGAVEDSTGRGADLVAEASELAVDPSVSPSWGSRSPTG